MIDIIKADSMNEKYRLYHAEIQAIAEEYAKVEQAYERDQSEQEPSEWLHETIDGHGYVIYTYAARLVDVISDTDGHDEYLFHFGEQCPSPEVAAFMCMQADVLEAASHIELPDDESEAQ